MQTTILLAKTYGFNSITEKKQKIKAVKIGYGSRTAEIIQYVLGDAEVRRVVNKRSDYHYLQPKNPPRLVQGCYWVLEVAEEKMEGVVNFFREPGEEAGAQWNTSYNILHYIDAEQAKAIGDSAKAGWYPLVINHPLPEILRDTHLPYQTPDSFRNREPKILAEGKTASITWEVYIEGTWTWAKFSENPGDNVLAALRGIGMYWHRVRKQWVVRREAKDLVEEVIRKCLA